MSFHCLGRKLSPNPPKRAVVVEKDEGISDEEDTAELKLQLELNEQVTRKKLQTKLGRNKMVFFFRKRRF